MQKYAKKNTKNTSLGSFVAIDSESDDTELQSRARLADLEGVLHARALREWTRCLGRSASPAPTASAAAPDGAGRRRAPVLRRVAGGGVGDPVDARLAGIHLGARGPRLLPRLAIGAGAGSGSALSSLSPSDSVFTGG